MTPDEAIARARAALAEEEGVASARRVARLDGGPDYWLVSIDDDERTLAVAAIGEDGATVAAARLAAMGRLPTIDESRARQLAGASPEAASRLAWFPSRASRSPLLPLWEVVRGSATVWVTMDGAVLGEPRGEELGP